MVYLSIGVVYKQRGLVLAVAGAKPVPIITYQLPLASATQRRAAAVFSGRLADKIVLATSKECRIKALEKLTVVSKPCAYVSPNVVIPFNIWVMRISICRYVFPKIQEIFKQYNSFHKKFPTLKS